MSAVIIVLARGAELCELGGRNAWAPPGPAWVLVAPDGLPLLQGRRSTSARTALCGAILSDPPDDAWCGSAEELAGFLAPIVGSHCTICHGSGSCDDIECDCEPPETFRARIRGVDFGARPLAVLRELLHASAPLAPARAWLSAPLTFPRRPDGSDPGAFPVLVVDLDGWRWCLAPLISDEGDVSVGVTL